MCGRVTLTRPRLDGIAQELGADFNADDAAAYVQRWNVVPTDVVWMLVCGDGERPRIVPATWGIPTRSGASAFNVKAENLRRGWWQSRRRSIVISDGFYEWRIKKRGQPAHWFHRGADPPELLLFAAIDEPLAASPRAARGCAIITVPPGPDVAPFHDREAALLVRSQLGVWLTGTDGKRLPLLQPSPAGTFEARAVSSYVNTNTNEGPRCIEPFLPFGNEEPSQAQAPEAVRPQRRARHRRQLSLFDTDS